MNISSDRDGIYALGITLSGKEEIFPLENGIIDCYGRHPSLYSINVFSRRVINKDLTTEELEEIENDTMDFKENQLVELRIPNSDDIRIIRCAYHLLEHLDISYLKNLEQLNCNNNKLISLKLNNNIKHLHTHDNCLKYLEVPKSIYGLRCQFNKLEYLHLPDTIQELVCDKNIKGLDNLLNFERRGIMRGIKLI